MPKQILKMGSLVQDLGGGVRRVFFMPYSSKVEEMLPVNIFLQ